MEAVLAAIQSSIDISNLTWWTTAPGDGSGWLGLAWPMGADGGIASAIQVAAFFGIGVSFVLWSIRRLWSAFRSL